MLRIKTCVRVLGLLGWLLCTGGVWGNTVDFEVVMQNHPSPVPRVPGCVDYAWNFNGVKKLLKLPQEYPLSSNGWSVDLFFRLDDPIGKSFLLGSNSQDKFSISIFDGSAVRVSFLTGKGRKGVLVPVRLHCGLWYSLSITQASDKVLKLYLNGEMIGQSALDDMPSPAARIGCIGAFHIDGKGTFDHGFKGLIDRPRLHDAVLSEEAIRHDWKFVRQTLPVIPMPRQFRADGEASFTIPSMVALQLDKELLPEKHLGQTILQDTIAQVKAIEDRRAAFVLSVSKPTEQDVKRVGQDYLPDGRLPEDGYLMQMTQDGIRILADNRRGALYALRCLQDLCQAGPIPSGLVFDWPEFPLRAGLVVIDSQPPAAPNEALGRQFRELAEQRMKYVMLRAHDWTMPDRPGITENLQKVVAMADACEMVVIPYLQSGSHAKGFLFAHPEFSHTITVTDEPVRLVDGKGTLSKHNVVRLAEIPIQVRLPDGTLLEENQDYTIALTPLNVSWNFPKDSGERFPWAKPYVDDRGGICTIATLPGGRLGGDSEISVTYDCSARLENTCPYLPEYQAYLSRCIQQSLELTRSDYVNLGLDEIWTPRGKGRCCSTHPATLEETHAYTFNATLNAVKANHPDVRCLAFSDMLDARQTPSWKTTDVTPEFDRLFSKEIFMMPWYYGDDFCTVQAISNSVNYFLDRGFSVVGTSGKRPLNQIFWGSTLYPLSLHHEIPGFVYTMWDDGANGMARGIGYRAYAQMSWSPDRLYIPALVELFLKMNYAQTPYQLRMLEPCWLQARQEYEALQTQIDVKKLPLPSLDEVFQTLEKADAVFKNR